MAILVTGGSGLVGAILTRFLAEKGEQVWVFDKWKGTQRFLGIEDRVRITQGDLGNFSKVLETVKASAPRVIYHLGGMLSLPCNADPQSAFSSNVAGTYHVLEAARLFNVPKVIFSSTRGTYGLDIQTPVIDDFTLQRPETMYGSTKVFAELLGRFYRGKYGIDFRALRFPSVIGPGTQSTGLSMYNALAVEKAFYGEAYDIFVEPEVRCPVLYFKDAARSLLLLEATPPEKIQTVCYLIAGVKPPISAGELVAEIKKHLPKAAFHFKPDPAAMAFHNKVSRYTLDDSRAEKEWGWKVEYSLAKMIADYLAELRANSERYR